jgi:hypothetical protein
MTARRSADKKQNKKAPEGENMLNSIFFIACVIKLVDFLAVVEKEMKTRPAAVFGKVVSSQFAVSNYLIKIHGLRALSASTRCARCETWHKVNTTDKREESDTGRLCVEYTLTGGRTIREKGLENNTTALFVLMRRRVEIELAATTDG